MPQSPPVIRALCSGGAPVSAAWVLLLWQADRCGWSVRHAGAQSGWLPGLALCRGRQPLVGSLVRRRQAAVSQGGSRASEDPLVGKAWFWGGQSWPRPAGSSVSLLASVDAS